jgi:hypothetical protein
MKNYWWFFVVCIAACVQILTTKIHWAFVPVDNQNQQIINRPKLYPVGGYKFEVSPIAIGYDNWRRSVWENININQYFFGGHPVERDVDFTKFPFWLLPIALIGIWAGIKKEWFKKLSILSLIGVLILGIMGNNNPYGPVVVYPFWLASIFLGIKYVVKK